MESTVNAPHPDERDDVDLFFGDEEEATGEPESSEEEVAKETAASVEDASPAEEGDAPGVEREGHAEHDQDPTPAASSHTTPPAGDQQGKKSGALEREYVVLQKVPLTTKALKHLLAEMESGALTEPRLAYIELDRRVGRNDKQVLGEVFRANRESLGNEAVMVGVSSRTFTERRIKPRTRPVEESFEIS